MQTGVVFFCLFSKIIPSNALGLLKITLRVYQLWMKKALAKPVWSLNSHRFPFNACILYLKAVKLRK